MKKIISLLLAAVMLLSLCACSTGKPAETKGSDNPASTGSTTPAATGEKLTIGVQIWSTDDILGGHTKQMLDAAGKVWNVDFQFDTPAYSADAQIASIENFIAAGVDGIMSVDCDESTTVQNASLCKAAGIPYITVYRRVDDPANKAELEKNEFFLGEIANSDYELGVSLAQAVIDAGKTKIAYIKTPNGNAMDAREQGISDTLAKAGIEVETTCTLPDSYEASEWTNFVENILNVYPETDCILMSCGSNGGIDAAIAKIATMGFAETCTTACVDSPDGAAECIADGSLLAVGGQIYNSALYGAVIMVNYLQGHPLAQGIVDYPQLQPIISGSEEADASQKYMIDSLPYSDEELANMLVSNNPDYTLETLMEEGNSFTIAKLIEKFK